MNRCLKGTWAETTLCFHSFFILYTRGEIHQQVSRTWSGRDTGMTSFYRKAAGSEAENDFSNMLWVINRRSGNTSPNSLMERKCDYVFFRKTWFGFIWRKLEQLSVLTLPILSSALQEPSGSSCMLVQNRQLPLENSEALINSEETCADGSEKESFYFIVSCSRWSQSNTSLRYEPYSHIPAIFPQQFLVWDVLKYIYTELQTPNESRSSLSCNESSSGNRPGRGMREGDQTTVISNFT